MFMVVVRRQSRRTTTMNKLPPLPAGERGEGG